MSKRAEKAALNAYPPHKGASQEWIKLHLSGGDCACFIKGYEQGEKDMIEMAIKWLTDRIDVPCLVATNENGEPLADSYIDYAKKRLEDANKIVDEFRKAMEEE